MPAALNPITGPDTHAAQNMYRWRSGYYDLQLAPYEGIRQHAIDLLQLQPGQVVLDIGCGTGMSLPALREAVGPEGTVIGIDQCPEMLHMARQRTARHGWTNVDLMCCATQQAGLHLQADAVLFHFTHDILQTPSALDQILPLLKPGAHIVATGLKWTSPLYGPLNALVWWNAMQSITTLNGMDQPWAPLAQRGVALHVEDFVMGTIYVASGIWPSPSR